MKHALARILSGSAIGQGVLLLVMPILTRLYSVDDFAVLTVVTALAVVLGGVSTLCMDRAVCLPESDGDSLVLLRVGLIATVAVTLISLVVSFLVRESLAISFELDSLHVLWWLPAATSFFIATRSLASAWLVRHQQHGKLGRRNAVQGLVQAAWSVTAGVLGFGAAGIGASLGVGRLAGTLGAFPWRSKHLRLQGPSMWSVLKEYRLFPLVSTWSRLANQLGAQAPTLLFAGLFGPGAAGLYALTVRVVAAPTGVLVDASAQFFEGEFSARLRSGRSGLDDLVRTTSLRLGLAALIPTIFVILFSPGVFEALFGSEWRGAGLFAQVTVVGALAQVAVTPVSRALILMGYQGTQLAWDVTRSIATSAAIVIPAMLGANAVFALVALTAVLVVWYIIAYILCFRGAQRFAFND